MESFWDVWPLTLLRGTVLFVLVAAVSSALASASQIGCSKPFVFKETAVNVIVLPTQTTSSDALTNRAATRLTSMIFLDMLMAASNFHSVGVVKLTSQATGEPMECTPDVVLGKLLGNQPGAINPLTPGQGVMLFWGDLHEDGGVLYLQNHLRFLQRDRDESVTFVEQRLPFKGKPASQTVEFSIRELKDDELSEIEKESAGNLSEATNQSLAFKILQHEGGRVEVQALGSDQRVWINGPSSASILRKRIPDLSFAEIVMGYLSNRNNVTSTDDALDSIRQIEGVFDTFQRQANDLNLDRGELLERWVWS